jgi:hypothetical protein
MPPNQERQGGLDAGAHAFYVRTLALLDRAGIPFLVGGAYALNHYTGISRHTKDFDVFVRREHYADVAQALGAAGIVTELAFPHWLGKASCDDGDIDVIFSSGNGLSQVDDEWFEHAATGPVLGVEVHICPPEEMIWQKAFITERERYDGADIMHLLLAWGERLDWRRLLARFDGHWRVLLAYLSFFGFVYSIGTRAHSGVGHERAHQAAVGRAADTAARAPGVSGYAALARAISDRHRPMGLRGRAGDRGGIHDHRGGGALDARHRRQQLAEE